MVAPLRFSAVRASVMAAVLVVGFGAFAVPGRAADQVSALSVLLAELEGLLGRPLDGAERTRCLDAGRRAVSALREQDHVFNHAVASLLDLPPETVAGARVDSRLLGPDVAAMLVGRSLTPYEIERMEELRVFRERAVEPVRGAYARDLASTTGLPQPAILPLLPRTGI